MKRYFAIVLVATALASTTVLRAADPSGTWTATFNTDIGEQSYTYEFVVKGTVLTGTAKGSLTGSTPISDGKVDGETITFVENATYMEMPVRFTYSGKMVSADQIEFTRNVMDIATEKITATRAN